MPKPPASPTAPFTVSHGVSFALRTAGSVFLWWILAEGRFDEPGFIAICLAGIVAASYCLLPRGSWPWRPLGIAAFLPFFLWRSLQGGVDVARRAFDPAMPLRPEIITLALHGSERHALLLAWTVSLLPGTAAVSLEGDQLKVHVLDSRLPMRESVRELEKRVTQLCD